MPVSVPSQRRFLAALAVSLLLHALVLGAGLLRPAPPAAAPPPALEARLRPATEPPPPPPPEPLLKNTLDPENDKPALQPPPAAAPSANQPPQPSRAQRQAQPSAAQRKLAANVFYPPEAKARGLEGVVWLLVVVAPDGRISDVQVASSSGHTILDEAAVRAAWAAGRLPGASASELILSVSFTLQ